MSFLYQNSLCSSCLYHSIFSSRITFHVITPTTWPNLIRYDVNLLFTSQCNSNVSSFACRITRYMNPFAPELFFLISAHPVYKM